MDRENLSAAIIQEMGAVFMSALAARLPHLLQSDLAEIERQGQQLSREVLGRLVERVAAAQEAARAEGVCPACGGRLWREHRARERSLQGLVGDYRLARATYRCAGCGRSCVPLDAQLGLGPGVLSPGLARVVCRESLVQPFAQAVESVAEAVGVPVSAEVARRTTEALGAVAEAEVQAAMARVAQGQEAGPAGASVQAPPTSGVLAVEVDGLFVHCDDGWHELKGLTVAPLGPAVEVDADTHRERLAWGRASYGAGSEEAQDFWGRVYVEACRRGLGTPAVRSVVVIADAAEWIWHSVRAFLGLPGVEVVEIIALYHAYEYLWSVGQAVFATEAEVAAWVEPLKTALYEQGPAPLQTALQALALQVGVEPDVPPPADESPAASAVRRALAYVTTHAARLDYPAFVARRLPIGSGAVESAGKSVIQARTKGAGMRWSGAGVQQVVALRTLWRSGRWQEFWQAQPQRTRLLLFPRAPRATPPASASPTAASGPAEPATALAPPPAPPERPAPPAVPRPLRPAADHPWRRFSISRRRSA
jgi:hypothetical protein